MRRAIISRMLTIVLAATPLMAQMTPQNPSPSTETTRPHPRIAKVEVPGDRTPLKSLNGAVIFISPKVKRSKPVPLVIHFHGAPWLVQKQIADEMPKAALITVNLGSGSRAYGAPFAADPKLFNSVIDESARVLNLTNGWSSVTLIGFSAGYGAIRQILRQPDNFKTVDNVLLLDGIHASYVPEGKPLGAGGVIRDEDLDSYLAFAREAFAGPETIRHHAFRAFSGHVREHDRVCRLPDRETRTQTHAETKTRPARNAAA